MASVALQRLNLPRGCIIGAIIKDDKVVVPRGSDTIEPDDAVVVLTTRAARSSVERLFRKRSL